MKVQFPDPYRSGDDQDHDHALRQAEYMKKAAEKLNAERRDRLASLKNPANRNAITRATKRLEDLAHPDQPYIVIRSEFLTLREARPYPPSANQPEMISTRPPSTRLLNGKNPHAHALYLTGIYECQMRAAHKDGPTSPPKPSRRRNARNNPLDRATNWITLTGLNKDGVSIRNQRRSFSRALDALRKCDLVTLGDTGQRYAQFKFCREDGSSRAYTLPAGDPAVGKHICLPREFFTAGWHLVLTPEELTTFLAVCFVADCRLMHDGSTTLYIAEEFRYTFLGLRDEAYESIHELAEFGLIQVFDPMLNRKRGRIQFGQKGGKPPAPYHISVPIFNGKPTTDALFDLKTFETPAPDRAISQLQSPLPRFADPNLYPPPPPEIS